MLTTWRPPEEMFRDATKKALKAGDRGAGTRVTWLDTAQRAVYLLDQYTSSDFQSNAYQPGGRFKIEYVPEGVVKAFKWWIEDPTANAGYPSGYGFYNVDFENDGPVPVVQGGSGPQSIDLSAALFKPPYTFYVSAFRHEKRLLKIQPFPQWVAGAPAGTALPTISITLTPPPSLFAHVTCESPDGFYNPRWRKVSFAMSPNDLSTFGNQPVYTSGYILSTTRIKTDSFEWPNGTNKYTPGEGRDVWMWRPAIAMGDRNAGGYVSRQYENQGQFRRIMEVGNDGSGNGFVEYERPFDPPIAVNDGVWFVDRCVMVRVIQTPHKLSASSHFDQTGEFTPHIGPLYVDTWRLPVRHFTNYEMPGPFRAGNSSPTFLHNSTDWQRRLIVQAYPHDANYADDGHFEDTPGASGGFSQDDAAEFPESPLIAVSLNAQHWPTVLAMKIRESQINAGKLRVELDGVKGDVCRWRLYVRDGAGTWPTVDGSQTGTVDETYFIGEYSRFQEFAETAFVLVAQTNCIIVPISSVGEPGAPCRATRAVAPETAPIIYNLKVTQGDTGGISKHVLTWQSNGAAQDITYGFRIEHLREDHKGISHGENPTKILLQVNNGVAGGTFTHDGSTAKATIDSSRGVSTNEYTVTHHYYLYISIPAGGGASNDVLLGHCSITDTFSDAREADVNLGTLDARIVRDVVVAEANGRTTTPLAVAVACRDSTNLHFLSGITQNSAIITYEYTINGGTTWHRAGSVEMDRSMSAHKILHNIWKKEIVGSGGTVVSLQYRAFYQRGTDFGLGVRRSLITSSAISVRLDDVAVPGPF